MLCRSPVPSRRQAVEEGMHMEGGREEMWFSTYLPSRLGLLSLRFSSAAAAALSLCCAGLLCARYLLHVL